MLVFSLGYSGLLVFSLFFFLRRPSGKNKTDKDSAALSFDEDLKAKLAAHNRGVTKGRHTYEPSKGRVKDWKKVGCRSG